MMQFTILQDQALNCQRKPFHVMIYMGRASPTQTGLDPLSAQPLPLIVLTAAEDGKPFALKESKLARQTDYCTVVSVQRNIKEFPEVLLVL